MALRVERNNTHSFPLDGGVTLYCPQGLRDMWPQPLVSQWYRVYPHLFDHQDLMLARHQPHYHFWEWFAAIHLLQAFGVHSLQSKYLFQNHPRKDDVVRRFVSESKIDRVKAGLVGQPPDLFVYEPSGGQFWFAEVKGPHDRLRPAQKSNW